SMLSKPLPFSQQRFIELGPEECEWGKNVHLDHSLPAIKESHKLWSSKLTIHILETQSKEQCMELMVPVLRSQEALEHCLFLWFQEHGTCHKIMHF
ncbi:hypothetical protein ACQP3F_28960, partial [Escherichia coli]